MIDRDIWKQGCHNCGCHLNRPLPWLVLFSVKDNETAVQILAFPFSTQQRRRRQGKDRAATPNYFTKGKSQGVHGVLQLTEHKAKRQRKGRKQKCPESDIRVLLLLKLIKK